MRKLLILIPLLLSGCVTLGSTGWIATHSLEIGQVGLVAGTVAAVENVAIDTKTLVDEVKK